MTTIKKLVLLAFIILLVTGCDVVTDRLGVINGDKYTVTSKIKRDGDYHYTYHLRKLGDVWCNYYYEDTANFEVGDTLIINIKKIDN